MPGLEQELALLGQDWLTPAALATAARELHRVWRDGSFAVRRQLVELAELRVQVPRCGPVRVEWLVFPRVLNPANDQRTV